MAKLFSKLMNADVTSPVAQNVIIYLLTYLLSISFSSIPYIGVFTTPNGISAVSWLPLTDCLVPATLTLTMGTVIQNLVSAIQTQNSYCAATFLSGSLTVVYSWAYTILRNYDFPWITPAVCAASLLLSALNIYSIWQVGKGSGASPSK